MVTLGRAWWHGDTSDGRSGPSDRHRPTVRCPHDKRPPRGRSFVIFSRQSRDFGDVYLVRLERLARSHGVYRQFGSFSGSQQGVCLDRTAPKRQTAQSAVADVRGRSISYVVCEPLSGSPTRSPITVTSSRVALGLLQVLSIWNSRRHGKGLLTGGQNV